MPEFDKISYKKLVDSLLDICLDQKLLIDTNLTEFVIKRNQASVNDYTPNLGNKLKKIVLGFLLEKLNKDKAYFYYKAIIQHFVLGKQFREISWEGKIITWQQIRLILIQKPYFVPYCLKRDGIISKNNRY